jgi:putative tryptophan/tyrosine transport system substrate-binding protein
MDRRRFLLTSLAGVLAAPLSGGAQQAGKVARVAYVGSTPFTPQNRSTLDAFLQGLRERGWVEGQNIILEQRFTGGRPEQFPELMVAVLQIPVDAIMVADSQAAWAAKRATGTTPIILANVADAVRQGLIASLARPGANITGLSNLLEDTAGKRLQILKEIVPKLSRVALVFNPNNPASNLRPEDETAPALGVTIVPVAFQSAGDLASAFALITGKSVDALILHIASPISEHWPQFIEFSHKQRLPTAGLTRRFVELGGLMYFGPKSADMWHRAAYFVDQVLRGVKPADLPVEQPTKFELVINLKTAKALGLTIPPPLLARADQVIE